MRFFIKIVFTICISFLVNNLVYSLNNKQVLILRPPLTFTLDQLNNWRNLELTIEKSSAKTVIFNWDGYGGIVSLGNEFDQMIVDEQNKGKVFHAEIVAATASMHAFSVCFVDSYRIRPGAYLLYHAPRLLDKQDNVISYSDKPSDIEEESVNWTQCVSKGVLNIKEVTKILVEHKAIVILPSGKHVVQEDN